MVDRFPGLPADASSLLIYGSRARGDAVEDSDLDALAVVASPRPSVFVDDVSLSFYTVEQLSTGIGTLFGAHLRRDSRIVWDDDGTLSELLGRIGEVDTDRVLFRAYALSTLFSTPETDLPKYLAGLLREARYLLRSCLYARAISERRPCFSVRELAARYDDPDLARLLASRQGDEPSPLDLEHCLARLRAIVGDFPLNRYGSLEATVVNEWGSSSDLLSMAFMALGSTGGNDYAEVEKILL